jgi:DNA-binding winged helix-turn-helix (wHTH) protein/tetratricopeptide (TPR) repeat protein
VNELNQSKREVYRFGPYRLDVPSRRLTAGGEPIALPPKAFELLLQLVRNSERAVRRTELLDAVWRDTVVEEGSLGWNMSVLRRALDRSDGEVIETVRGYGYRLALPVAEELLPMQGIVELEAAPAPVTPEPELARAPGLDREGAAGESAPRSVAALAPADTMSLAPPKAPSRRFLGALAALVGLLALGFTVARLREPGRAPGSVPSRASLAVLPFENLSARPDQSWLSSALAEILSSELTIGRETSTVPQESVARAVDELAVRSGGGLDRSTLRRLQNRLGLDLVVVGSYVVAGEPPTLRVDLRLQDASDGSTRFAWSESRPATDVLALISNAGIALRGQLSPSAPNPRASLSAERAGFAAPPAALRAYSEGLELRRGFELAAARQRFEQAVAAAPDFVIARAALADLLAELGYVRDALAHSRRALANAGALAPVERLPIAAKNRELESRWAEAAEIWRELVRLDPSSLDAGLALAHALARGGGHAEARATLDELSRRPPPVGTDPRIELERGWAERYAQDLPAMEAAGLRAVAVGRTRHSAYVLVEALALVSWADLSLGKNEPGLAACTEGMRVAETIGHHRLQTLHSSLCGWILSSMGRTAEAEAAFRRSFELAARDGHAIYESGALLAIGWLRAGQGRLAAAAVEADKALALARGAGDREREVNSLELVSYLAYERADLDAAENATVEALAKARELDIASRIASHLSMLGNIRLVRGDVPAALAAQEEAVRVNPRQSPDRMAALELGLAFAKLDARDAAGAIALCDRIDGRLRGAGPPGLQQLMALAVRGRAEAMVGRVAEARAALAALDRARAALADPVLGVQTQLQRGLLLTTLGDDAGAEGAWRSILDDPAFKELEILRLSAAYELADLLARRHPTSAAKAELVAARRRAREAKLGFLFGEKL